ncbi:type II toxin-antitoxin system VapC family toxin [Mucilaginibacter sp. HMF5004]|uniref:type II toxin-antitoxin system VapC family toxin n=1 Tax=Mucilaginibacter rivuli TaxID=2857527 RepID=UPI001C5DACB4|nr:type II toxin-antitoxin system VapC family toxin [Mucilaginibacter rivuli]MBW4891472.1 type II toxin-antitoxin system VapC family toxin [Mucilaginibacter rivuli]
MEQPQYLIDTNVIIDYLGHKLTPSGSLFMDNIIDNVPNVSVISKIEVLGFNAPDEHYQLLVNFMNDALVLDLTSEIVDVSIAIRKKHKTKLPDAIIAATAKFYGFTLISRNTSDFKNIEGLTVIDLYKLQ